MRDIFNGLQPSMYTLIGLGTFLFVSWPKQIKKWKAEPPEPVRLTPLRTALTTLGVLAFAFVWSVMFSPDASYASINFAIICALNAGNIIFTRRMLKRYAKPSSH